MFKHFSTIWIIVIVAVAAGAWGLAWIKFNVVNAPKNETTSTSANLASNLKTYTNEQYGFEFKYPQHLLDVSDTIAGGGLIAGFVDSSNTKPRLTSSTDILVSVRPIVPGEDFRNILIKSVAFDGSGLNPKSFDEFSQGKFGDNTVYFIRSGLFEGLLTMDYFLIDRNRIFSFLVHSSPVDWTNPDFKAENDPLNRDVQKILSTFKFLEGK